MFKNSLKGQGLVEYALVLILIFIVLAGLFGSLIPDRMAVDHTTGTVTDKYIKRYGDSDIFHIAVTYSDGTTEVFQNKDTAWWWKWNSADFQQEIKQGHIYTFTVTGWRVPFLSWLRNITEFRETAQ